MELEARQIHCISEFDFDGVIAAAGGTRIDDSLETDGVQSADYLLGNAVIELKILEEEGFEKPERQKKMAALFTEQYPEYPVVVLQPYLLVPERRRKLFRILETPMKTLAKKASKQLAASAKKFEVSGRVLIVFNSGYMSLRHEDFKELVLKCVRNDTSQIDHVVVAGMYYEYDGFELYFNIYFEHCSINASRNIDLETLDASWASFVADYMDGFVKGLAEVPDGRLPNEDITFDVDGRTFVRTRDQVGKPSAFFPHGRPRKNSSGIERCPPVATVVPSVQDEEWELLSEIFDDAEILPESFRRSKGRPLGDAPVEMLRP